MIQQRTLTEKEHHELDDIAKTPTDETLKKAGRALRWNISWILNSESEDKVREEYSKFSRTVDYDFKAVLDLNFAEFLRSRNTDKSRGEAHRILRKVIMHAENKH